MSEEGRKMERAMADMKREEKREHNAAFVERKTVLPPLTTQREGVGWTTTTEME